MTKHLGAVLATTLFVCAVLTAWLSVRYFFSVRELQRLQQQYAFINNTRSTVQALAQEAVEYGKRNPAIEPILQQFDLKPKAPGSGAPAALPPRPATK